jgi:hypothetical protein
MATEIQSTRRSALRFSAAAFASSLAVPALAKSVPPDADSELIELARQLDPQWEAVRAIEREAASLPKGRITSQSTDQERRLDAAMEAWWHAVDRITDISAQTPSGLQAKAYAMRRVIECMQGGAIDAPDGRQLSDEDIQTKLIRSLTRDMLTGSAFA